MLAAPFFVAVQRVHADLWARVARSRRLCTWAVAFEKNGNVEAQWNFKCGISFPGRNRGNHKFNNGINVDFLWNFSGVANLDFSTQNVKTKFS